MKEGELSEKYPNTKGKEGFKIVHTMVKTKLKDNNCKPITLFFVSVVVWCKLRRGEYVDEFFHVAASERKVDDHFVLSQESIQQTLKNYTGKRRRSDLFFSVFIGILCATFLNLILFNGGYDFTNIFALLIHVITPLVVFGMIRVGTILNRTKIKNSPYIILRAKITGCICTPPIDSGSDNYYFVFDCNDYGSMLYEVSSYAYDSAVVDVDEYYLVVVKRRFSKKYEIVKIFSTEQYELSPALEKLFG